MNKNLIFKFIAYCALLLALTFISTIIIVIPMPSLTGAYINFGDIIIFISSSLLGPLGGFIVGSIGSTLADLIYAPLFIPVTFIVKGLEGLISGFIIYIFKKYNKNNNIQNYLSYLIAFIMSATWMVIGYYLGTGIILGIINNDFINSFSAALINVPNDIIQGIVSIIFGYTLTLVLLRMKYVKDIQNLFL